MAEMVLMNLGRHDPWLTVMVFHHKLILKISPLVREREFLNSILDNLKTVAQWLKHRSLKLKSVFQAWTKLILFFFPLFIPLPPLFFPSFFLSFFLSFLLSFLLSISFSFSSYPPPLFLPNFLPSFLFSFFFPVSFQIVTLAEMFQKSFQNS